MKTPTHKTKAIITGVFLLVIVLSVWGSYILPNVSSSTLSEAELRTELIKQMVDFRADAPVHRRNGIQIISITDPTSIDQIVESSAVSVNYKKGDFWQKSSANFANNIFDEIHVAVPAAGNPHARELTIEYCSTCYDDNGMMEITRWEEGNTWVCFRDRFPFGISAGDHIMGGNIDLPGIGSQKEFNADIIAVEGYKATLQIKTNVNCNVSTEILANKDSIGDYATIKFYLVNLEDMLQIKPSLELVYRETFYKKHFAKMNRKIESEN